MHFAHAKEKQEDILFADNYDAVPYFHPTVAILSLISDLSTWQPWSKERAPDAQKGIYQLRETTLTENIVLPGLLEVGIGLTTQSIKKTIATKSEEATAKLTLLRRNGKQLKDLILGSWNVLTLTY